jgi:hypothetical protein
MAGLVPAIHVFLVKCCQDVDARHKAGHDESKQHSLLLLRADLSSYFFTSGHSLASSGFAASSGEIVAISL